MITKEIIEQMTAMEKKLGIDKETDSFLSFYIPIYIEIRENIFSAIYDTANEFLSDYEIEEIGIKNPRLIDDADEEHLIVAAFKYKFSKNPDIGYFIQVIPAKEGIKKIKMRDKEFAANSINLDIGSEYIELFRNHLEVE